MIVQYIVLRRDLAWPAGAMAAQAAHAAVAALAEALQAGHKPAATYIDPHHLPHMTKYVYGVDNLAELELVREQWNAQQFASAHPDDDQTTMLHWWVEQPENIPTALATWPVERTNKVSKTIKNMKLTFF